MGFESFFGKKKEILTVAAVAALGVTAVESKNMANEGLEPLDSSSMANPTPFHTPGSIEAAVADHIKNPTEPIIIPSNSAPQQPAHIDLNETPAEVTAEGSADTTTRIELDERPVHVDSIEH